MQKLLKGFQMMGLALIFPTAISTLVLIGWEDLAIMLSALGIVFAIGAGINTMPEPASHVIDAVGGGFAVSLIAYVVIGELNLPVSLPHVVLILAAATYGLLGGAWLLGKIWWLGMIRLGNKIDDETEHYTH